MLALLALLVLPIHFPTVVRMRGGAARHVGLPQRLQLVVRLEAAFADVHAAVPAAALLVALLLRRWCGCCACWCVCHCCACCCCWHRHWPCHSPWRRPWLPLLALALARALALALALAQASGVVAFRGHEEGISGLVDTV